MSAFVLPRLATWPLLLRSVVLPVVLLQPHDLCGHAGGDEGSAGLALCAEGFE
jgi:hypothetical protein